MARKQKSVAELWEELTGKDYIVAYVNGERPSGGAGSTIRSVRFLRCSN